MPIGDCERMQCHHCLAPAFVDASTLEEHLPSRMESNHTCVSSEVVQTSKLGPAARYRGMRAVSTVERKRRGVVGIAVADAMF